MKRPLSIVGTLAVTAGLLAGTVVAPFVGASSHREAPLISNDPAADTTDMYVFRSPDAPDTITAIMNVYPFGKPEQGPNFYLFDPSVRYSMHITNDGDASEEARLDFQFRTEIRGMSSVYNDGPITSLDDPNWLTRQFYSVDLVMGGQTTRLGENLPVPPANVGPKSTPNYEQLANAAIVNIPSIPGGKVFAGPRDDPFFIDIGAAFDLLNVRRPPGNQGGGVDNLAGFNVLSIAVQVPIAAVGRPECDLNDPSDMDCVVGMWITTSRQATRVLRGEQTPENTGDFVQVARQSAALVNELVVPTAMKDAFNASNPNDDARFLPLVQDPIPAQLINAVFGIPVPPAPRADFVTIFLTGIPGLNQPPDVQPAEIAHLNVAIPVTAQPNRLGLLGNDMQGYPNGRRLADDVTDISLRASAGGTPFTPEFNGAPNNLLGDGVDQNDRPFLNTFPYLATPHQGFDHTHDRGQGQASGPAPASKPTAAAPAGPAPASKPTAAAPPAAAAQPAAPPAAAAQPAAQPRTGTSGVAASGGIYTVQQGDTLSSISEAVYGTPDRVEEIRSANPEISNPDVLQPGVVLTLPAMPDSSEEGAPSE